MKKTTSLFLVLLLLLSLFGCSAPSQTAITVPPSTTAPVITPETQPAQPEKIVIPLLVGKVYSELPASEDYQVVISGEEYDSQAAGTILSQEPEGGSWVDQGTTIYVVVSKDQKEGSEIAPTLPEIYQDPEQPEQPRPSYPQQDTEPEQTDPPSTEPPAPYLDPNGSYTTRDDVALYLHLYGRLPNNFITKSQAEREYGWDGGSLSRYGKCIGGDRYYNREGNLPSGYTYYECDIDTLYSSRRGAKRLVFTYSGIIYYTSPHYETFIRLY